MALRLSALGAHVVIADNLSRRRIDQELQSQPLLPIAAPETRVACWEALTGQSIEFVRLDMHKDLAGMRALLERTQPAAVIHFGEQRSAPYSMKSAALQSYTVSNNLSATTNLLASITELKLDPHIVHLGSIGVYGYDSAGITLPEGYMTVTGADEAGRRFEREILYPGKPVSLYHVTKAQDQLLFQFYAQTARLRITDLHQGIVWGTQTDETRRHANLTNRFDHDDCFGTVVNRFLTQAGRGAPLTVHGTGRQTRGFIHISDTVRCIALALENPPEAGERVKILNQVAETRSVLDVAEAVKGLTGADIRFDKKRANEPEENTFEVDHSALRAMGFTPTLMADALAEEVALVRDIIAGGGTIAAE